MTLDEIRDMWREDCVVDQNDLDTENFKCTVIHEKYLSIWSQFKLMLSDAETKSKMLYKASLNTIQAKHQQKYTLTNHSITRYSKEISPHTSGQMMSG